MSYLSLGVIKHWMINCYQKINYQGTKAFIFNHEKHIGWNWGNMCQNLSQFCCHIKVINWFMLSNASVWMLRYAMPREEIWKLWFSLHCSFSNSIWLNYTIDVFVLHLCIWGLNLCKIVNQYFSNGTLKTKTNIRKKVKFIGF